MHVYTNRVQKALLCLLAAASALFAAPIAANEPTPLIEFKDGFPMELERETRDAGYNELFAGGDVSAYFNVRVSEFLPTAILPSRQGVMPLGSNPMPKIGSIKAEMMEVSELEGPLTLDQFLERAEFAQAFLVVHEGDIVFEKIPDTVGK